MANFAADNPDHACQGLDAIYFLNTWFEWILTVARCATVFCKLRLNTNRGQYQQRFVSRTQINNKAALVHISVTEPIMVSFTVACICASAQWINLFYLGNTTVFISIAPIRLISVESETTDWFKKEGNTNKVRMLSKHHDGLLYCHLSGNVFASGINGIILWDYLAQIKHPLWLSNIVAAINTRAGSFKRHLLRAICYRRQMNWPLFKQ